MLFRSDGTLLKYVHNVTRLLPPGSADRSLMAFQHRLCITNNASNRVPWRAPDGYRRPTGSLVSELGTPNESGGLPPLPCV